MSTATSTEIPGEGKYLKVCVGCKKPFRSDARNTRYSPFCKCAEKKAKTRNKRRRERRSYHRDPARYQERSRVRALARKIMEAYLREHGLEPGCAHPNCDKQGWKFWKGTLQVHHTFGGDIPPNPPCREDGTYYDVKAYLGVVCRSHHDLYDQCIEKNYLPVLYVPLPDKDWGTWLCDLRRDQPKKFWFTPRDVLFKEFMNV
jgi:hypothetical protein